MTLAERRPSDPRPAVLECDGVTLLSGWQCLSCRHPVAHLAPWCPICRSELAEMAFGPHGQVWSSTLLRVPLPGRQPPYVLAYVDLDRGPRILAHVEPTGAQIARLHATARVHLSGLSALGDVLVRVDAL
jgi:uncharacterized OB-fold protein